MLFNLAPAVALLSSGTYVVSRRPASTYTKGARNVPIPSTLEILASVQPDTGLKVNRVSEGKRNEERITLYTETELYSLVEGVWLPDTIVIDGFVYEVESVQRWSVLANYFEVVVVKTLPVPG